MPEEFFTARNGQLCIKKDGVSLHSSINPSKEAQRFITAQNIHSKTSVFIVCGSCLNYLCQELHTIFPTYKILCIQFSNIYKKSEIKDSYIKTWYPNTSESLHSFLQNNLTDNECIQSKTLVWKPAIIAYSDIASVCLNTLSGFLDIRIKSNQTELFFGKKWFNNSLRNLLFTKTSIVNFKGTGTAVITAAGPSLEYAIPEIKAKRSTICLIAVSSACSALLEANLRPDIIVHSDGGYWSRLHLHKISKTNIPIIASLQSAIPAIILKETPILYFSDQSFWQNTFLQIHKCSFSVPARGTVSASAIDIALAAGFSNILLCGYDFNTEDIKQHARPYALDQFCEQKTNRFLPHYSIQFNRSKELFQQSLKVYSNWFKEQKYQKHISSIEILISGNKELPYPVIKRIRSNTTSDFYISTKELSESIRLRGHSFLKNIENTQHCFKITDELRNLLGFTPDTRADRILMQIRKQVELLLGR